MDVIKLSQNFDISGKPVSCEVITAGHINDTYLVKTEDNNGNEYKYIFQRINTYVFKDPDKLMSNIFGVTGFLRNKLLSDKLDAERGTLNFIKTIDGKMFFRVNDNCYRMYRYVDHAISYNLADSTELFKKSGLAFGRFALQLSEYDASKLYETIPDFHNTKKRFDRFCTVVNECTSERKKIASAEIEFAMRHKDMCSLIVDEIENGKIPLKVTHNDTKLNNILIDEKTGEGICIIDLDTIMPGSVLYDFGDSIRFGASSALEDESDLEKVYFRNDMFKAYAEGYLEGAGGTVTEHEKELLPMGACIITFETGMRFLTDYLENDVYFKTKYPDHNLVRARNQFKLVLDMETRMDEFNRIIKEINV